MALTPDGGTADIFVYDAFGRRQKKVINGTETDFLWDQNDNLAAELTDGGEYFTATDLEGFSPDELVCRYTAGADGGLNQPLMAMTDINGSVLGLVSDGGVIQATYAYEPYGATQTSGTDNGSSQQYAGRENDGTGVYYNRARYYMPSTGRFLSEDPIGIAGLGLYLYAADNPVQGSDPSGSYTIVNCPGADQAQQVAQQVVGCSPTGTLLNECTPCAVSLRGCNISPAAVCDVLADGSTSKLIGLNSLGKSADGNTIGADTLCTSSGAGIIEATFAYGCGSPGTLFHEALHAATDCTDTGSGGDNNLGPCGSYDLQISCFGYASVF